MRFSFPGLLRWPVVVPLCAALALVQSDARAASEKGEAFGPPPPGLVRVLKDIAAGRSKQAETASPSAITIQQAPSNDDFEDAEALSGTSDTVSGTNLDATAQPGEPDHSGLNIGAAPNASIWYTFTAPRNGALIIDTLRSNFDTVLAVYTGDSVDDLTPVALNDQAAGSNQSRVGFLVDEGVTYNIAVDGFFGDQGDVVLNFELRNRGNFSPNDNFDDAIALEFEEGKEKGMVTGNNFGATSEAGEPNHSGEDGAGPAASIWYTITPSRNGALVVNTFDSDFDTVLAAYSGNSVDNLTQLALNNQAAGGNQSEIAFAVDAGETYFVAVDGFFGDQGNVVLRFERQPRAPFDDFAEAERLTGDSGKIKTNNIGATAQPGEPVHAAAGGISSVWFRIRPQNDRVVTLDTFDSGLDTNISVYTGDSVDDLTLVADNEDGGTAFQSQVAFPAQGGTTYHVAVDGFRGQQGAFDLKYDLSSVDRPANDDFSDAEQLSGRRGSVTGTNRNATKQPFESSGFNFPFDGFPGDPNFDVFPGADFRFQIGSTRSVWYQFEPNRDGVVVIDTFGSDFDTVLFVYEGEAFDDLRIVALNDDASERQSSVAFFAQEGLTYNIAVEGFPDPNNPDNDEGDIRLNFKNTGRQSPPNDDFEDAITLRGESGVVSGFNLGATAQNQEPASSATEPDGGASVWWQWRAPFSGPVTFTTARSSFDTVLTVWQGGNLAVLDEVASNNDASFENRFIPQSLVTFDAEEGQLYRIEVDGGLFTIDDDLFVDVGNISLAFMRGDLTLKADVVRLEEQKEAPPSIPPGAN